MNPKKNPANWAAWGKLQYPFYFAKQLDKMNKISSFCWIKAEGESDLASGKYLDFVVAGTPVDLLKGRIERYQVNIGIEDEKKNEFTISPSLEYKLQYPVLKAAICGDVMAVRTLQEGAFIYRLNKPPQPTKLKFSQLSKQNSNSTLAWRTDREALLAASNNRTIYIWDINTQKCKNTVQYHKKEVTDLVWLNDKFFASASLGGEICLWSVDQAKPICGFKGDVNLSQTASTSLALAKSGSIQDAIILSGTDKVVSLWQKGTKNKIQFSKNHTSSIVKVEYQGVACKQRLFAALDQHGRIVLYDRNGKEYIYNNSQIGAIDFNCKAGLFGVVSQSKYLVIWTPPSARTFHKAGKSR